MTSHKEHIQVLIAEIDNVLQRTNPRLPWVMSGEVSQQRQVLERVRNFLVALQQTFPMPDSSQPLDGVNTLAAQVGVGSQSAQTGSGAPSDLTPYQMMQAILQEVRYLRANLTPAMNQPPPNQSQLTAELLQVLMSRLQENLTQQISQTLNQLRHSPAYNTPPMLTGGMPPVPAPSQYEQLQNLRSRSDQMLVNLDSTLNVVFESLQRNIQAYQEALSQGLERMYSMGQQSEYTFKVLIDQLAQQLKQEASSYLLGSPPPESSVPTQPVADATQGLQSEIDARYGQPAEAPRSPSHTSSSPPTSTTPSGSLPPSAAFPYAGAELLSTEISGTDFTPLPETFPATPTGRAPTETPLDSAIESWLQSVSAMNLDADLPPDAVFSAELPTLDLSELELEPLDVPAAAPVADSPSIPPPVARSSSSPFTPTLSPSTPTSPAPPLLARESAAEDDTADIDAVLKLLEELSAEVETSESAVSLEDAEAQLEQMLGSSVGADASAAAPDLPDDAQEELDEFLQDDFYQSLFGSESEPDTMSEPASAVAADTPDLVEEPALSPVASAELTDTLNLGPLTLDEEESMPSLTVNLESAIAAEPSFELTQPFGEEPTDQTPLFLELPADLFETNPVTETTSFDFSDSGDSIDRFELNLSSAVSEEQSFAEPPSDEPLSDQPPSVESVDLFDWDVASEVEVPAANASPVPPVQGAFEDVGVLSDLFQDVPDTAARSVPVEVEEVGSLSDLFQDVPDTAARSVPVEPPVIRSAPPVAPPVPSQPEELFLGDDLFGQERASEGSEDQFTRAAVDEILLPEAVQSQNGINLEVDDLTLSSLSEDLSNLEEPIEQPVLTFSEVQPQELDLPTAETASAASPVGASGEESLSLDDFAAALATPGGDLPAPFYQASPAIADVSVEGFADLFGDAPPVPQVSIPSISINPAESLPFSLEGTNQLFAEPISPAVDLPVQPAQSEPSPFTLEGMDDLFSDAPALNSPASLSPSTPVSVPVEVLDQAAKPFTLEGMDDLFGNVPSLPTPAAAESVQANPIQPPLPPARREIPPFRPELFHPDDVVEADPPFKLEQLDNLFAETPAEPAPETAIAGPPAVPDQQSLDAAFESLLGTPPPQPTQNRSSQVNSQKKKTP